MYRNTLLMTTRQLFTGAMLALATTWATPAHAQLNGENLLGDLGVQAGTQPQPGIYVSQMYFRYRVDSLRGPDGERLVPDPTGNASQTMQAGMPVFTVVTKKTFFGAHFGVMAVMPFANGSLEAPGFGLSEKASTGASDLYVVPLQLGWHTRRADVTTGLGFFAPTGRHAAGASDNLGKGMWSYEASGGATLYLDRKRSFSVATNAAWETHSRKEGEVRIEDVAITNVKVGQLLTLEGGIGKSFLHGGASIGMAYYAQWKVTRDQFDLVNPAAQTMLVPDKHRVWGVGPDVTVPIATKTRLISRVNVRYLWETGAELKTQGQTLTITATFPLGGVRIGER